MTNERIEQVRLALVNKVVPLSKKAEYARIFECGVAWADENPVNPWHDAKKELPPAKEIPDIPDYSCSTDCVVKVGDSSFYKIAAYDHHFECWCDANDYETIVRNVTKWMLIKEETVWKQQI